MNIAIFFDATEEQQKKLLGKFRLGTIAGWYTSLRLDPFEDSGVPNMDVLDFRWEEILETPLNVVVRGTQNGEPFSERRTPDKIGRLGDIGSKRIDCLYFHGLVLDYNSTFDYFIEEAWLTAFKRAGIKDYAIVIQHDPNSALFNDAQTIKLKAITSGAFEEQSFITFFSGHDNETGFPVVEDSINTPYRFWDKEKAQPLKIDDVKGQLEIIMTLEHAMAAWSVITNEDFEKVKQLDWSYFIYLVNNYDYESKYDELKDRFLGGRAYESLSYLGHLINCVCSIEDMSTQLFDLCQEEEERLDNDASVTLEGCLEEQNS